MNVVREIQASNRGREPERLALKYAAMRAGPFAFLRGTCALFHARLPRSGPLKSAPLAWQCGDLHLANFGSYKGDNRLVYFDLNDFDEAALAPAALDLVRLLASVHVAASQRQLKAAETRTLCEMLLQAYAAALAAGKPYWLERETAQGAIAALLTEVAGRMRPAFLDQRTRLQGRRRVLRLDNGKALAATAEQQAQMRQFMAQFAAAQPKPAFFEVLDVARRIAGTGSLGVERYSILVRGKGTSDGNYLLDLKRALPPSWSASLKTAQPRWPDAAQRAVEVQRRMQAMPVAFLHAVQVGGRPFVLRALHPSEDRIDFQRTAIAGLPLLLATLGRMCAWAQLRSAARQGSATPDALIDFGRREKWRARVLAMAEAAAVQVGKDAATFNVAYDDGAFAG